MSTVPRDSNGSSNTLSEGSIATQFTPSRWTITRKLVVLMVTLVSVCFGILMLLSTSAVREDMLNLAKQNYSDINSLIANQSAGAIRWNKASQVETLFNEKSGEADSNLKAMRVFSSRSKDASWFSELQVEGWDDPDAEKLMAEHGLTAVDKPVVFFTDKHIVTISPVILTKKNELVGSMVSAWSTDHIEDSVASITRELALIVIVSIVVLSGLLALAIMHGVGIRIRQSVNAVKRIADGNLDQIEEVSAKDEIGELAFALNSVQQSLKAGDDSEKRAHEFGRIKQALDCASAGTLLIDAEQQIVYVNTAVKRLFESNASAFSVAGIDVSNPDNLIGQNLSMFFGLPEISAQKISGVVGEERIEVKVSNRTLDVNLSAVIDDEGQRVGTVLEWLDKSREINAEAEVKAMVDAAQHGDFTHRIDIENMQGFYAQMGKMLNSLAETSEQGLNDTLRVIKAFEVGDLSVKIEKEYEGIFNELKISCNATSDKLAEIIADIRITSEEVKSGASDISNGNIELSSRTEVQASSLEETASAMEQINSIVQKSAQDSKHVHELVEEAKSQALQGGEVSNDAVRAMGEISESSKKISVIIGVINDIAFQTNLLALNAAVEAARAGEQGRGFSVVASEVGNLAGRSASAAKEIKSLIEDSVQRVSEGERLVGKSGRFLTEIVSSVNDVSQIASEMASSSVEQSKGIDQINTAILAIDDATQRNAALAEQTAAASEAVGEQAGNLDKLVGFFRSQDVQEFSAENLSQGVYRKAS